MLNWLVKLFRRNAEAEARRFLRTEYRYDYIPHLHDGMDPVVLARLWRNR